MERISRAWPAEFIATFALVFIGAGAVVMSVDGLGGDLLGVAIAHGLTLAIMVTATAHLSGGHVNPAVTIGLWVTGRVESARAVCYILAQLAGGAAGALALKLLLPEKLTEAGGLGTPVVNHSLGMSDGAAVGLEAVLTFFLVFTVYATAADERGPAGRLGGFAIGLVLTIDILVGGPLTGAAMNPARAFGPELVSGTWTGWWVYWVGPIIGGLVAGLVYWLVFLRQREDMGVEVIES
ncbi:MAG: MIP family channel protein [Actinomycetota bacterium]